MLENPTALYAAFKAKDPRLDGRFFVGVSSTGIYCRPVCPAKTPKIENCVFFPAPAAAEAAGYRPCLICRPELAPEDKPKDAASILAFKVALALEELDNADNDAASLAPIAARLGYSERHLSRVFTETYKVTPARFLLTKRLLLANSLLTDTNLSVLNVALTAGFKSLRAFNEVFKKRYRLKPSELRPKKLEASPSPINSLDHTVTVNLGYRPPYQWETLIKFFAGRAIKGVEKVENDQYFRVARLKSVTGGMVEGWFSVAHNPSKNALAVTISESLVSALPEVLARIKGQFDLYGDPLAVDATLSSLNDLAPGLLMSGTRVPGSFEPFEMTVRAVLGQQITVKAAGTLASKIATAYGQPVPTSQEGLNRLFPTPSMVLELGSDLEDRFGQLGVTAARSRTIRELARAFNDATINFNWPQNPDEEIKKLTAIKGIGPWTAGYIALRAMGHTDVILETDYGVKKALTPRTPKEILKLAEEWRPYRSYATVNLWNSL
ncbi:MAG: helix-turn-helix domain-containing protein [Deltaproteobacteria bacterium]|jgi:AraC family transcriptional regulator of adaptative response / DNA-3-methyladenine glycosylase II|nr:helix-turn-helix domain-containing protein [Deltaproteobacteria bacterium]